MRPGNLPGVVVAEPVVWILLLPAVHYGLFEHAVFITQTIACRWELHRGHRIEEACREAAQATVPKAGIWLLLDQFYPVDAFFLNRLLHKRIQQKVSNIVGQ